MIYEVVQNRAESNIKCFNLVPLSLHQCPKVRSHPQPAPLQAESTFISNYCSNNFLFSSLIKPNPCICFMGWGTEYRKNVGLPKFRSHNYQLIRLAKAIVFLNLFLTMASLQTLFLSEALTLQQFAPQLPSEPPSPLSAPPLTLTVFTYGPQNILRTHRRP